jgi:hypothetical protein
MSAYRLGISKRVSIIAALVTLPGGTATAGVSKNNLHFSIKKGRIVRRQPSGASFELPEGRCGRYFERSELDKVKRGKGEWYMEYARIAKAALRFEDCSAQESAMATGNSSSI